VFLSPGIPLALGILQRANTHHQQCLDLDFADLPGSEMGTTKISDAQHQGVPKNGWFIMENPNLKWMMTGGIEHGVNSQTHLLF